MGLEKVANDSGVMFLGTPADPEHYNIRLRADSDKRFDGFLGTLGVSEVNITLPEYLEFLRIIRDEAGDDFVIVHHGSWSTREHNIEAVHGAQEAGADLILLSYPPDLYPETAQEIYDYTKAVCDVTDLAVILFPMYLWGFRPRIHPADLPSSLIRRLMDDCPNVAVIKAEGGLPFIQGIIERHRVFGDEVVISIPLEADLIPLSQMMRIQLSATADHEYDGPMIPQVMEPSRRGRYARPPRSTGNCTPLGRRRPPYSRRCTAWRSSTARPGISRAGCRATTVGRYASPPSESTTRK